MATESFQKWKDAYRQISIYHEDIKNALRQMHSIWQLIIMNKCAYPSSCNVFALIDKVSRNQAVPVYNQHSELN